MAVRDRELWVEILERVSRPVLEASVHGKLRASMPVEFKPGFPESRTEYAHLEAVARLLSGMAPWLESASTHGVALPDEELRLCEELAGKARDAIRHGCDAEHPDAFNFREGLQPIVEASFMALALLRAPSTLWMPLSPEDKQHVLASLRATRSRKPYPNNWVLFAAAIEAFFHFAGEEDCDPMRIDYAIRQHEQWYLGGGIYGDGAHFAADYYNSFVIQPYLVEILDEVAHDDEEWRDTFQPAMLERARLLAGYLEHMIAPDGSYPALGRSITYRCGAFHALAQSAWREDLPELVSPGQARRCLTAVIRRTLEAPGTFNEQGWLQIGLSGHQPDWGEGYISTGSLYLCSNAFLPLGLAPGCDFWSAPDVPTTWESRWGTI